MMKLIRPLATIAAAGLFLVSCEPSRSPVAPTISEDFATKPPTGTFPAPGNGVPAAEIGEICKYGTSASFHYTVTDRTTGASTTSTITVADGDCEVLVAAGGMGVRVSITEDPSSGYQLDSVIHQSLDSTGVTTTVVPGTPNPTIVDSATGSVKNSSGQKILGVHGFEAKFFNHVVPPPQLAVVKTPKAGTFAPNGQASFTIVVSNPGTGAAATNVALNDALPGNGGLVWQTATTTQGSCSITSNALSCSLGSIVAGASVTVTVSSTATTPIEACTTQSNPAAIATADGGLTAQDNGSLSCTPPPPPSGEIGDYVWEDDNGDGIQDVTETGIAGVTVTLSGPVSGTTTTDANGNYLFTGLPAGSYTVTVGTPAGLTASPSNQGGDTNKDSNGSPASVTLATNSSVDLSIDFGFVPPPTSNPGRMTGGGKLIDVGNVSFNLGLTLHCDILLSNNLEINWPGSAGVNNFHITRPLTSATCILDPNYKQPPPAAPFNTFIGVANGTLNGIPGATARFTFIDAGEPGRNDLITLQVFDANNNLVLDVPQTNLDHGNLQAHYDQPHGQHGH